ncbi:MAG: M48 family metallopeptidase [Verrucomicrobiota bacterium]
MDFFKAQDQAHQKTRHLLLCFSLALLGLVLSLYFLTWLACSWFTPKHFQATLWHPILAFWVVASTTIIVGFSTLFKIHSLSSGGYVVAESLGGRLLLPNTTSPQEKRLLNIVEEMAIASNMPPPAVYLLEEPSINAFAAGFSPSDQIIGVTRGCIETLNRDELQGVIAHEFSHLLNGDTRLNMRLIGVVFGILIISLMGEQLMNSARWMRGSKETDRATIAILFLGLGLLLIGSVGSFFGNLIQAAISRQREFLADASAVQFTRNPRGIVGALKKIGGLPESSLIRNAPAQEASHLFFSNGISGFWHFLLSTHPPLEERIRAIDPEFNGVFPSVNRIQETPASPQQSNTPIQNFSSTEPTFVPSSASIKPSNNTPFIFAPTINEAWKKWLSEADQAWGTLLALLVLESESQRSMTQEWIKNEVPPAVFDAYLKISPKIEVLTTPLRHSIALHSITALRGLSKEQYQQFSWSLEQIIALDGEVQLFEYAIQKMVRRHLEPYFQQRPPTSILYQNWNEIEEHAQLLLSAFTYLQGLDQEKASLAFQKNWLQLALKTGSPLPPESCSLEKIDHALQFLVSASDALKAKIIQACQSIVTDDGVIQDTEATLLLAVTALLK